jgi:hypothetical protein
VIGLTVGGLYVPREALIDHQLHRGLQAEIYGSGPMQIPDVADQGVTFVILGPSPTDPAFAGTRDVLADPVQRRQLPMNRVPPDGVVVFE